MVRVWSANVAFLKPVLTQSPTRPIVSSAPASSRAGSNSTSTAATSTDLQQTVPRSRYVLFFSLAVVGSAADLLTKQWIFNKLGLPRADNVWWIWEGYFGFETALNRGALFGLGAGYSYVFASLSVVAAIGILYWLFYHGAAQDRLLTFALGCVMAGIFGNLYDRLGMWTHADKAMLVELDQHAVRDWILFRYGKWTWPNFNIADAALVCGAACLMWHAWFLEDPDAVESKAAASDAS